MWKLCHKIQKFSKRCTLNLHWCMTGIEHDAVLVVIHIWRILEIPLTVVDRHRNDSVVLSCRVIYTTRITFIFFAKLAFWICTLLCILCCCNCLWIFLRLRKIDRNIECSKLCICCPLLIFFDTLSADIIAVAA